MVRYQCMIFINQRSRKKNRYQKRNYSRPGIYYVTICTEGKEYFFGDIVNNVMRRSTIGEIADRCWNDLPIHFPNIDLGQYIVMPDHFHGIICIKYRHAYLRPPRVVETHGDHCSSGVDDTHGDQFMSGVPSVGVAYMRPLQRDVQRDVQRDKMLLPKIIHEFKSAVTRIANKNGHEYFQWQRSYYDHIVRDAWDLHRITNYIKNNPKNWTKSRNSRK